MFRPFKGEVVDAVVTQVNKVRNCAVPVKQLLCRMFTLELDSYVIRAQCHCGLSPKLITTTSL